MHGLRHVTSPYVFLTEADTYVPRSDGIGYLVAEQPARARNQEGRASRLLRSP
jgi:hypothetical protein